MLYSRLSQYHKAKAWFKNADDREKVSGKRKGIYLGNLYRAIGTLKEAGEQHSRALEIARSTGSQRGIATHLTNLAN